MPDSFPDWDIALHKGTVLCNISSSASTFTIHTWWSKYEGEGNARSALKELKAKGKVIRIYDCCNEGFWKQMQTEGLVDYLD